MTRRYRLECMRKWLPFILIAVMVVAILLLRTSGNDKDKDPAATVNRDRGFDRRISYIEYSKHATCRMNCRQISTREVEEIMRGGKINYNKSDIKNARCPRYALEGRTSDQQRVRIIFAQCNESTVVVTAIDLETDFACHCPGDDDKYNNK
jgi:hypothetical protein